MFEIHNGVHTLTECFFRFNRKHTYFFVSLFKHGIQSPQSEIIEQGRHDCFPQFKRDFFTDEMLDNFVRDDLLDDWLAIDFLEEVYSRLETLLDLSYVITLADVSSGNCGCSFTRKTWLSLTLSGSLGLVELISKGCSSVSFVSTPKS